MNERPLRGLPSPALGAAEIALNRYLASDERALARCRELAGRALELRLVDLGLCLVFVAETHGVQLRAAHHGADVVLSGRAPVFARVLFSGEDRLTDGGLRIEGDVGIAQRFADLFSSVDVDLADLVDARLGPVPARFIGQGLTFARGLLARAACELPEQTAEYLREETRDVVGAWEHQRFAADVEAFTEEADRLEQRIRGLEGAR